MKILKITLENYIGIFNGTGLNKIEIDFTKAKNGLILIIGDNGSGKTSLLEALNILPDDNKSFIKDKSAYKELFISHEDLVYQIKCNHEHKNGKRETAKAYITRIYPDGEREELNPNGNITSYKEAIFQEFELDANFLALSYLSSVKKGLGAMTASERKVFVNSIIRELVSYNDMYKVFCKRSNSFKSIMNNIISKMNLIGDEERVRLNLTSIENRINKLMETKDHYIEDIASCKSRARLLDPNGDIQNSYNVIYNNLLETNGKLEALDREIKKSIVNNFKLPEDSTFEDINKFNELLTNEFNELQVSSRVKESEILSLINDREKESKDIQEKVAKIESIKITMEHDDISSLLEIERQTKNFLEEELSSIGILDIDISKEEFILGIETLNSIREFIGAFKSHCDYDFLNKAGTHIINNTVPNSIDYYDNYIDELQNKLQECKILYNEYYTLSKSSAVLANRPSNCIIDTCSFIKNALEDKNRMDQINIELLDTEIQELEKELSEVKLEKEETKEILSYINSLNNMIRDIKSKASILLKLPIDSNKYLDKDFLVNMIMSHYDFPEVKVLYDNITKSESIELYKQSKSRLEKLENEYNKYSDKINTLDELNNDILNINKKLDDINNIIDGTNKEISNIKDRMEIITTLKMCFNNIFNMFGEKKELENKKIELLSSFNNIKNDMIDIKNSINQLNELNAKLENINNQITPLMNDRDKMKFGLAQLEQYQVELQEFNSKYEKVETFKKYSSPTKDGIQNIFIELYMHQTLSMTNEILSLLFDGNYIVGDFDLNDKEFSIPVYGNGLPNDDISSMSNAEVSMIQMIISFVMLHQSSTKYNIVKLDELDSMLDTNNRLQFTFVLDKVRTMLNIEQTFMISHNNELNLQEASIILLKHSQEFNNDLDYIFKLAA